MDHKTKVLPKDYGKKTVINKKLAKTMKLDKDEIKVIEGLQAQRDDHYRRMKIAPVGDLREWDDICTNLEFRLQKAWGFTQDINFHKFWERPRCTCPKMDNDDNYPHGYYTTSMDCPLHGEDSNG